MYCFFSTFLYVAVSETDNVLTRYVLRINARATQFTVRRLESKICTK